MEADMDRLRRLLDDLTREMIELRKIGRTLSIEAIKAVLPVDVDALFKVILNCASRDGARHALVAARFYESPVEALKAIADAARMERISSLEGAELHRISTQLATGGGLRSIGNWDLLSTSVIIANLTPPRSHENRRLAVAGDMVARQRTKKH